MPPALKRWLNTWSRKLHRYGAVIAAIPVLVVVVTGLLLQVKQQDVALADWVQPPTQRGAELPPSLSFDQILTAASSVPQAEIADWSDVDRLDVRPSKGVVKVRAKNRWEIQVDTSTGEILQVAYRRSDLIESMHDGSFFSDRFGKWVFLINGLFLFGLWLTGIYLWALPIWTRRRQRRRRQAAGQAG